MNFEKIITNRFAYLLQLGFNLVEASPTIVRYFGHGVEIDVYHGRQSNEIGVEVTFSGTRFSLSELIRAGDPRLADTYRNPVATAPDGIDEGAAVVARMLGQYGGRALRGEEEFFTVLARQRQAWSTAYALQVKSDQVRPLAEGAFRAGNYLKAAELYRTIVASLTPSERRKLAISETRSRATE